MRFYNFNRLALEEVSQRWCLCKLNLKTWDQETAEETSHQIMPKVAEKLQKNNYCACKNNNQNINSGG